MKKLKKNKIVKRVLGLSFCLAVLSPLTLYFSENNINDPPTEENAPKRLKTPNRARIDDETYTSYDIEKKKRAFSCPFRIGKHSFKSVVN